MNKYVIEIINYKKKFEQTNNIIDKYIDLDKNIILIHDLTNVNLTSLFYIKIIRKGYKDLINNVKISKVILNLNNVKRKYIKIINSIINDLNKKNNFKIEIINNNDNIV